MAARVIRARLKNIRAGRLMRVMAFPAEVQLSDELEPGLMAPRPCARGAIKKDRVGNTWNLCHVPCVNLLRP